MWAEPAAAAHPSPLIAISCRCVFILECGGERSFISHLSCALSPGNNGALHHITRLLGSRRRRAVRAIIGRTIASKRQVGLKKGGPRRICGGA